MLKGRTSFCSLTMASALLLFCSAWHPASAFQFANDDTSLSGPLFRVAPENCWLYSTWSNQANPDADSSNYTDRLLAEPEVSKFVESLVDRVGKALPMAFSDAPPDQRQQIVETAPVITSALLKKSGCLFVEKVAIRGQREYPQIEGVLLLEIGGEAEMVASGLAKLVSGEAGVKTVQIAGSSFAEVTVDPASDISILIGNIEEYLFIGIGEDCVRQALQRLSGSDIPVWLKELDSRHRLSRRTTLGFINVREILGALLPLGGASAFQVVSSAGMGNVQSVETSSGYSETGMVNRILMRIDGKPQGALSLFGDNGIQPADVAHIPSDSLFAMSLSLDAEKVFNFVQGQLLQFSPRDAESMMRGMTRFQQETGVDLRNEIINQIGPTWCLYNGASDGWFTGMALTVSLQEPKRVEGALKKLVQAILAESDGNPNAPRFTRRMSGESEIYSVQLPEIPLPFEPGWCISGNRLIVGMFPQTIAPFARPMQYLPLVDSTAMEDYHRSFSSGQAGVKLLGFTYQDSQKQFEILYPYLQMFVGMSRMFLTEMGDLPPDAAMMMESLFGGIDLPPARSIHKHLLPAVTVFRQVPDGFEIETRQTIPMIDATFVAPAAVGIMLPSVQQVRVAARRTQSANNLRQMALAAHNYESIFGRLPSGNGPEAGDQSPVSWRVRILPYLERNDIYDQYRFDEPWDSEHNLQFLEMMPEFYRSPNSMADPTKTVYRAIGGKDGAFGPSPKGNHQGRSFGEIVDGTSNTIMFIEASDELAVPWTQPDEGIDPGNVDFGSIFGMYPGGTNAALCDGSVQFISELVDRDMLSQLMKINDGEPLYNWDMEQPSAPGFREKPMDERSERNFLLEDPESTPPGKAVETLSLENFGDADLAQKVLERKDRERLHDVMLAMHNWHDAYKGLPTAWSQGDDGQPRLSWRVHLLPFMGYGNLYNQFHLDEPWDSEHNREFLKLMPACYQTSGSDQENGKTTILAIGGEHGVISKTAEGRSWMRGIQFQNIVDGLSNTIALIDAAPDMAVEWTRPDEFVPDAESIARLLRMERGFYAGFADGSVHHISPTTDPDSVGQLFVRDDGEPAYDWRDKSDR